jgi:hypothetical protein
MCGGIITKADFNEIRRNNTIKTKTKPRWYNTWYRRKKILKYSS